jgi:hypothetical protein
MSAARLVLASVLSACAVPIASLEEDIGGTEPVVLHVSAAAALPGDGTRGLPFRRITDALAAARAAGDGGAVRIEIEPGTYLGSYNAAVRAQHPDWEVLPLVVNVSRLEIVGSTRIVSGLGPDDPIALADETIVTPDAPLAPLGSPGLVVIQSLLFVGPTVDRPAVNDVTVRGLVIDGASAEAAAGLGIHVDRVAGFRIEGNVIENLGSGLRTRASSGTVIGNVGTNDGQVIICAGGSVRYPSRVLIVGNRCDRNPLLGLLLVATGTYKFFLDFGTSGFTTLPVPKLFDLDSAEDRETVPDTLEALVIGNDCSDNDFMGIRVFEIGQRVTTFDTASLAQRITTHLRLRFVGNRCRRNASFGLSLDAGFPERVTAGVPQPDYTGSYELAFDANDFGAGADANGEAPVFIGFTRLGDLSRYKPLRDATIDVAAAPAGQLAGAEYDNPATDTAAGDPKQTPLDNVLTVNGVTIAATPLP